mgnify:FL=1|tara:strand:- start:74 stop:1525 length:1452 start_codon:yes stop_codon:yes gene_type:complete
MADSPKLSESSQALFCAVVDYLGKPINGRNRPANYPAFKKEYGAIVNRVKNKVKTGSISVSSIERYLTENKDWYESSINIANELFNATKKIAKKTYNRIKPVGISLFYIRGDKGTRDIMSDIALIWKYTNTAVKKRNRLEGINDLTFNDINKWSPADIYLASQRGRMMMRQLASGKVMSRGVKIGKTKIDSLTSMTSFSVLNAMMKQMMEDGDILPLSLKKAPRQDSVVIKTINFMENDVANALKKNDIRYHGYIFSQTKDVFNSKDVYIKITSGPFKLQFRDKGGTGGGRKPTFSYQCIISGGKQALDGSLAGDSIGNVIFQTNQSLGRQFSSASQSRIIDSAFKIAKNMQKEIDVDGILSNSIQNTICRKVYEYAKKYSGVAIGSLESFYEELVNHPQFSREGTSIMVKEDGGKVRLESELLVERARAQFLFGKFMGGRLIEGMERSKKDANEIAINLLLYAGSRTSQSSPHVKASDISSL